MTVIARFAPSPTGRLHVGNVRTALLNWLFVREQSGKLILRIDDTDLERSTNEYEQGIKDDLTWLGLNWDSTFNQSHRFPSYEAAAKKLKEEGLLYPCYETADELDRQRKLQRVQSKPPVYNRAALELTDADRAALEAEGRKPHWRFKLSGNPVTWDDVVRGEQTVDTASLSDPVLIREDGSFLYTLPSVVDDIEEKITHVIRGEDHVTNSGAQIEVFRALSNHLPKFAHTPLLVGKDGKGLSKRLGSLSMQELREQGLEPMAICSLLAKIGTSDPIEARPSMDVLKDEFSFSKIGRAPARFDEDELLLINGKILHETPYADVKDHLDSLNVGGGEAFWNVIRANVTKVVDAAGWSTVIYSPMPGRIEPEDVDFCKAAANCLPDNITADTWSEWIGTLKVDHARKGKTLFMPLRRALTGRDHGPEMGPILMLMGAEKARARLRGETA
ncbi:glutamate--tRNA ligase [Litorimonas sp. RW-G-Af-16]|uniref:glutamate--tRNA ligase n=1 Tax=Litorimonas sp. RW-G-Af-16 TaxID=3241168 RepID=UPI00390C6FBE